jgi:endonuclease YncB( thermonuclease family)
MACLLTLLTGCGATPVPEAGRPAEACRVTRVVDGDTVDLVCADTGRERARLVGYDTPEVFSPGCREERRLGTLAAQRLERLQATAERVEIRRLGFDGYDRRLVRIAIDGTDISQRMVAEGLAVRYNGGRRINWCRRLT